MNSCSQLWNKNFMLKKAFKMSRAVVRYAGKHGSSNVMALAATCAIGKNARNSERSVLPADRELLYRSNLVGIDRYTAGTASKPREAAVIKKIS